MNIKLKSIALAVALALPVALPAALLSEPVRAQQDVKKDGWYRHIVDIDFVKPYVDIPPKPGVMLIDSRPAARQYDPGHIPGAINIPDSQFDKLADKLPADKATLLIFYCGGFECMLSHQSAFKAEKLGYTNIRVYSAGSPDWAKNGTGQSVSAAYIKKLQADKAPHMLIDARPKRTADKGMIPGAVNISESEFDKNVDKLSADKATPLIIYCGGLECVLSDKVAAKARALGYTDVKTYPEGYPEWEKLFGAAPAAAPAGAAAPAAAPKAAALEPGKEKGSVTVASFEKVLKEQPDAINLVDVRDAKEFAGGTIKGAKNIPMNALEKAIDQLPKDKPTVFICGTGARSGEAYDTVKLVKADLPVYFIDATIKFLGDGKFEIKQK
ncbi:rhodanese-like domain-containing protein [Sulfurisoma sediminicola]|uniref:3-mercaptopyruvate sulfurtransferase SseA n=1 Tax=Sulfurisoma sediminicola TaxID=1381557 RepID=A0A497X823_9PROT|nr:rhodanese-like domain-containing protein [Sulfurisoma sediminicola]RLJ62076.1 3-mercaptopyruvate sulfurtransferase SseA [Sulfurisoma sediminicola]